MLKCEVYGLFCHICCEPVHCQDYPALVKRRMIVDDGGQMRVMRVFSSSNQFLISTRKLVLQTSADVYQYMCTRLLILYFNWSRLFGLHDAKFSKRNSVPRSELHWTSVFSTSTSQINLDEMKFRVVWIAFCSFALYTLHGYRQNHTHSRAFLLLYFTKLTLKRLVSSSGQN